MADRSESNSFFLFFSKEGTFKLLFIGEFRCFFSREGERSFCFPFIGGRSGEAEGGCTVPGWTGSMGPGERGRRFTCHVSGDVGSGVHRPGARRISRGYMRTTGVA